MDWHRQSTRVRSTPQCARELRMSSIGEEFHPNRQFIRICPWKVQKLDLEEFVDPPLGQETESS